MNNDYVGSSSNKSQPKKLPPITIEEERVLDIINEKLDKEQPKPTVSDID